MGCNSCTSPTRCVIMDRVSLKLINPVQAAPLLADLWRHIKAALIAGHTLCLELRAETRTTAQNRLMHSCLADISRQVEWMIDGAMVKPSPEDWKDILSAGLKKSQRVARGIDGGFVMLGQRTSKMTVKEMTEMIDLIHYFGDQRGVIWSDTSLGRSNQP